MYSFCLPNLLKECWRLRLNFCTVDKFPLLLRSVAIDEPGFCWLFPFPPCMRTTSPPENERNFHEDIQKSCQMTTSSNANCDLTRKLPDGNTAEILLSTLDETEPLPGVKIGGNYGNIYVKWVNPELHIVIWRKKKQRTSIAENAGGILLPILRSTSRRENKGNYVDISIKWLNPELHIVIWRKKHCTSIAGNAAGICVILDVNHFPAWKKGKL